MSPFLLRTRFTFLPPALVKSQGPIRSTCIMAVLYSTVLLLSIPQCLFSLMPVPVHFAVAPYLQTWRHNPHLSTFHSTSSKRTYVSEYSGLGYDCVIGRVVPDVSKVHWESLTQRHGVISQKTWILGNTAVRVTDQRRCDVQYVPTVPEENVLKKPLDKHTVWNYLQYYKLQNF